MNQDIIWDHFQNEGLVNFEPAGPRLYFLVRRLNRGERVLNIGVGAGALEDLAIRKGVEIWSLDPSERTINRLRRRLDLGERAQTGYSEKPPFPSNHFDVVIMTEVLEHLDEKTRQETIKQVRRILRPRGRFLGTVPARERLELSEVVCPNCEHHFHRWGHQATFDVPAMRALLERDFVIGTVDERFLSEWDSVGWGRRALGLVKKFLSWRGLGAYGVNRNIFFNVRKPGPDSVEMRQSAQ